jgi:hypothetical protein
MSNAINRLVNAGSRTAAQESASEYRAYVDSGGRPQMGFAITRANGDMDGFQYHNLDNQLYQTRNGSEFLSFTHRGKAVTIQGTKLKVIFRALMRQTLMEIHEADGRPVAAGDPTIIRMEITTVGPSGAAVSPVRLAK